MKSLKQSAETASLPDCQGRALTESCLLYTSYPELTTTYVATQLVKLVRGDISMDQWDEVVTEWYSEGGDVLTEEANAWYATVQ